MAQTGKKKNKGKKTNEKKNVCCLLEGVKKLMTKRPIRTRSSDHHHLLLLTEVKLRNAIQSAWKKVSCTEVSIQLKTNCIYWYQVQGQLLVTGAAFCDFCVLYKAGLARGKD